MLSGPESSEGLKMSLQQRLFWIAASVLLHVACATDPEVAKREFVQRGDAFVAEKKYEEATIEYRNAVQLDPRFAEARRKLSDVYQRTKNYQGA